jgi:tetratricopeptide (TPR) repeat protein
VSGQAALHRLAHTTLFGIATWCAMPAVASAQAADAFGRALVTFTQAQQGTFGDEGPQLLAALETLDRALAAWDSELLQKEQRVAEEVEKRAPEAISRTRVSLGLGYLRRGRIPDAAAQFEAAIVPGGDQRAGLLLGLASELAGRPLEAALAFQAAWLREPRDLTAAYRAWQHRARLDPGDVTRLRDAFVAASSGDPAPRASPIPPLAPVADAGPALLPLAAYAEGYRLLARHEHAQALAHFRAAVRLDSITAPGAPDVRLREGTAALRAGRVLDAIRLLDAAVQGGAASADALRVLALAEAIGDQYESSAAHLEAAVRRAPLDERARVALARVLVLAGRTEEAARVLHETVAAIPASGAAQWWLSTVYSSLNRGVEARQALESPPAGLALTGRRDVLAALSRLLESEGDFAGAVVPLLKSMAIAPNDPLAHLALARAYKYLDRADDVLVEYVMALALDPGQAAALVGIGQAHLAAGRLPEAIAALERGVALMPSDAEGRYALATALRRAGRHDDADVHLAEYGRLQSAATRDRQRSMMLDVLREEAALRAASGERERTLELWRQVVAQEPGLAANQAGLGKALAAAGQLNPAIEAYERALTLPVTPRIVRDLVDLYELAGRHEDARRTRAAYEELLESTLRPSVPAR